jgi:hypothetical protein
MPDGFGRGSSRGFGGGMGFGFRGSSPPWPDVGRGRGGLPRCGYFTGGPGAAAPPYYAPSFYGGVPNAPGYPAYAPPMTRDEELNFLKEEGEAIKRRLEEIESRMGELEKEE